MFKKVLLLLSLLFPLPSFAMGGAPIAGGYVPYADIPVWNYDNLAVGNCNQLEPWANCLNTLVNRSTTGMGSPVIISTAGTYTGISAYSSTATNPIKITATTGTVIIIGAILASNGADLIENTGGAAVTAYDNQGFSAVGTVTPGKFYSGPNNGLNLHDNVWAYLWGSYIFTGTTPGANVSWNFGYNNYNGGGSLSHEIQFNQASASCATIENNTFINAPYFSHSEDVMNFYQSPATSGCHAIVSFNHILGAYPIDPAISSYSGGGIIMDGTSGDTSLNSTQYYDVNYNVVLETTNYGIAAAAGFGFNFQYNIVVNDGLFGGGVSSYYSNVAAYSYNQESSPVFNGSTININNNSLYWWDTTTSGINTEYFAGDGSGCNGGYSSPNCTNTQLSTATDIPSRLTLVAYYVHKFFGAY